MTQFTILHGLLSGITYLIIINALILIVVLYTQASQQLIVAVEIAHTCMFTRPNTITQKLL